MAEQPTDMSVLSTSSDPEQGTDSTTASDPQRRRLLGGLVAAGGLLTLGPDALATPTCKPARARSHSSHDAVDLRLRQAISHIVVIYAENRSFNNLFPHFPGLAKPLSGLVPAQYQQRDRNGRLLPMLPPIWGGLAPNAQVVAHRHYQIGQDAIGPLHNAPFALRDADGRLLPHGVVTRDLVHRFYENQMQINGGRNDHFAAWADSGGLVMGHYGDASATLHLGQLARRYTLCDNFFMGAFGGSFLNHHYLIAAQPCFYPEADRSPARSLLSVLSSDDPHHPRLALHPDAVESALKGPPRFVNSGSLTPDFWAINTMAPPYHPSFSRDSARPAYADRQQAMTLPPQTHRTIGDALDVKGIDWAWYAGGWGLATQGRGESGDSAEFPTSPNFQPHHQPFNYFAHLAPGTAKRQRCLRDGGIGDSASENHFIADIQAGRLPAVSFYKPQGNLNMHAGYSDVAAGDQHIARVVDAIENSPIWNRTVVIITFDENGGWWDHVAPPLADRWGPGTRVPALVVSPWAKRGTVDHTVYDTGSIQRLINRRFGLDPLPGLVEREKAMYQRSGIMPGDLTQALDLFEAG